MTATTLDVRTTGFAGPVHVPGDTRYDAERAAFRPFVDSRPAVIVEAAGAADVQRAIGTARDRDLPFAVQGAGHGTLVPADGVLLKTGRMARVEVDPDRRIARTGPGARWQDVLAAAAPFGLAPLSGDSPAVGVTGYTLGGGLSWLSRRYGFAADSLVRAELVTADGRHLTASADRHPDLFWAIRGGGGNFGVVTSLEFRLYPVARIYGGTAYFPIDRAAELLTRFREAAPDLPDELAVSVLLQGDSEYGPVAAIRGAYAGKPDDAVRALRPIMEAAGTPIRDGFRSMPYAESGTIGGIPPRGFELFAGLPDGLIGAVLDAVRGPDAPAAAIDVALWGGAMARPGPDAGPAGHRDVPYAIKINGPAPAVAPLLPYATGGSFLNFLSDTTRTHTAFTPANYARLRQVKRAYDPDNFFHHNHSIPAK